MTDAENAIGLVPDVEAIAAFRHRPGAWLTFAGSAFLLLYAARLRPLWLKPSWVTALAIIAERPGITQSALGRALTVNRASAMALATQLEQAGYVLREAAPGRQRTVLSLTPLGRRRLAEGCAVEDGLVAETMGGLDEADVAGLVSTLKRITAQVNMLGSRSEPAKTD